MYTSIFSALGFFAGLVMFIDLLHTEQSIWSRLDLNKIYLLLVTLGCMFFIPILALAVSLVYFILIRVRYNKEYAKHGRR